MKDHRYGKLALIALTLMIFVVGCEPLEPVAPTLISPEDGAVFDTVSPIHLIWSAEGWNEEFYFYIAFGSVSDTLMITYDTSFVFNPSVTSLDGRVDASYEWAVAPVTENETLWSNAYSFEINTQKFGPVLLSPTDSSEFSGETIVFSWTSDQPADLYTLYVESELYPYWPPRVLESRSDTFFEIPPEEYQDWDIGNYTWYVTRHVGDWRFPSETRQLSIVDVLVPSLK